MRYGTANAFRAALEQRLLTSSRQNGVSIARQRKVVVFERFLARLLVAAPDRWLLKGALALDFRLGARALATQDLDLVQRGDKLTATDDLITASEIDLGDYFAFVIETLGELNRAVEGGAVRYREDVALDDRRFEHVTVDIGFDHPHASTPELLVGPDILEFAGIPRITVPALPLALHVAEKVHADARSYSEFRQNTRVKDLVDLVLISSTTAFAADDLRRALRDTFNGRQSQVLPGTLPAPPSAWTAPYQPTAREIGIDPDIEDGYRRAAAFLDPLLDGTVSDAGHWDPAQGGWQPSR